MTDLTKAIAITLSLSLGTAALAQETTTEAPAADAATTEAPAADAPATEAPEAAPEGLAMGAEQGAGAAPEVYLQEKHGDWEQRCVKQADGSDPCQLYQLLKDEKGNSVAEISLFPLPEGTAAVAGATIIAPLETLLTANIVIQVDDAKGKVYPFTWCDGGGCVARVGFTAEEVAAFKAGNKATMVIVPALAPDQKVNLNISLAGFTAGYDAVAATSGN